VLAKRATYVVNGICSRRTFYQRSVIFVDRPISDVDTETFLSQEWWRIRFYTVTTYRLRTFRNWVRYPRHVNEWDGERDRKFKLPGTWSDVRVAESINGLSRANVQFTYVHRVWNPTGLRLNSETFCRRLLQNDGRLEEGAQLVRIVNIICLRTRIFVYVCARVWIYE